MHIHPLEENVEIRYMPKGIYCFTIPPLLDNVCILILEPCHLLKSVNVTGKWAVLIKMFSVGSFFSIKVGVQKLTQSL